MHDTTDLGRFSHFVQVRLRETELDVNFAAINGLQSLRNGSNILWHFLQLDTFSGRLFGSI